MRSAFGIVLATVLLMGCSGTRSLVHHPRRTAAQNVATGHIPGFGQPQIPTPPPTGTTPDAAAVRTIRAWSNALRRGDVRTAASYFNLPSEMINGVGGGGLQSLTVIHNAAEATQALETLPCGAKFISADKRGRYVNALFRLTSRSGPGGGQCGGGTGQTARTNFLIVRGRIVEWIRAPDDPGDNSSPASQDGGGSTV
jgi:hypothetical protein